MTFEVVTDPIPLQIDADGVVRVGGTRVTLDTVVAAFADGATAEEIVQQYPAVSLADVYTVLGYYRRHTAAVEAYLQRRQQEHQAVRQQNEQRMDPRGVRARLLARRRAFSTNDPAPKHECVSRPYLVYLASPDCALCNLLKRGQRTGEERQHILQLV